MDISLWYNLNSKIKILETNKKFYNTYMHKMVYDIPGSYVVTIGDISNIKNLLIRNYSADTVEYKLKNLQDLYNFYKKRQVHDVRCRIERNFVSIFGKDVQSLYQLATNQLSIYVPTLLSTVTSEKTQKALEQGFQILKQDTDYKFKVIIRDGFYKLTDDRKHLANYLRNLGNEIKITENILSLLESNNKYINSGYFYVKDSRIVDLIKLIAPTAIRSVQPIVVH